MFDLKVMVWFYRMKCYGLLEAQSLQRSDPRSLLSSKWNIFQRFKFLRAMRHIWACFRYQNLKKFVKSLPKSDKAPLIPSVLMIYKVYNITVTICPIQYLRPKGKKKFVSWTFAQKAKCYAFFYSVFGPFCFPFTASSRPIFSFFSVAIKCSMNRLLM